MNGDGFKVHLYSQLYIDPWNKLKANPESGKSNFNEGNIYWYENMSIINSTPDVLKSNLQKCSNY